MAHKSDIRLHGAPLNIVRQCGPHLSDILTSKFGCVATFEGVDFENDPSFPKQKKPTVAPEKRFSVNLPAGVTVSVWKADLTNFPVDAVVNAANSSLLHGGGLAQALCEAGGPRIQHESDIHTNTYGPVSTGDTVVTNAGNLPCKIVIHAVGPQLSYHVTRSDILYAKPMLEKTIRSILRRVEEHHLDTVAIPAISSGLFNYPLQECADTIVSTVKQYYEYSSSRGHFPREIFFVNHDEPTVSEMERACHQLLARYQSSQSKSYSQAAGNNTRGAAKASNLTVQIGTVHLTLKRDKIEDQKTDVIVNTASSDRDLSKGEISKALLKKAGHKMQEEILRAQQAKHVIITNSYNLQCKEVLHTFCSFNNGQSAAQKVLFDSVLNCLWTAASRQHNSISFPAIGTGHLGFKKEEAAHIMSNAVFTFAKNFPERMEVYFVIFPSDNTTFQAFEEKIKHLQHEISHSGFTQAYGNKEDFGFNRAPTPLISLNGPSEESMREAEKWLRGLFTSSFPVVISNNFIQHLSEKQYLQLARLTKKGVKFEEFLTKGHACLTVDGDSAEDIGVAALQVEAMLCTVQKEFVTEEENEMLMLLAIKEPLRRVSKTKKVDDSSNDFLIRSSVFRQEGLKILKVDKVENRALELLFELKKKQLGCSSSETMFQRIPAQFCEMISQIGFHAECAPPEEPRYGEGIYFVKTLKKAMEVWRGGNDEYLYFVEAEVLTGKSTHGKPGLILPPTGTDPTIRFDSVSGGHELSVIFSGYQALPKYIITCKKM